MARDPLLWLAGAVRTLQKRVEFLEKQGAVHPSVNKPIVISIYDSLNCAADLPTSHPAPEECEPPLQPAQPPPQQPQVQPQPDDLLQDDNVGTSGFVLPTCIAFKLNSDADDFVPSGFHNSSTFDAASHHADSSLDAFIAEIRPEHIQMKKYCFCRLLQSKSTMTHSFAGMSPIVTSSMLMSPSERHAELMIRIEELAVDAACDAGNKSRLIEACADFAWTKIHGECSCLPDDVFLESLSLFAEDVVAELFEEIMPNDHPGM